jgi:hypothetical protein
MKSTLHLPVGLWPELRLGVLTAVFLLGVGTTGLRAQNDASEVLSNVVVEAAALMVSNAVAQMSELSATNEPASNGVAQVEEAAGLTNALADTNLPAAARPGPLESRRQWLLRQRAGAPATNEPGPETRTNETEVVPASDFRPRKPGFGTFKLITERNIFDPNRSPRRAPGGPSVKPKITESLALVGVMSYEKGTFAFFDGSRSEYRKTVKLDDTIAGYKVTNINAAGITLAAGTNQLELRVGMHLRKEEGGTWTPSSLSETYAVDSTSTSTSSSSASPQSPSTGADSDVLERLRKRREQE